MIGLTEMKGMVAGHIEGVEFAKMGQDKIGRYPVHFHMVGVLPVGTYVRYNSIRDTNFRCLVIHGSHGVTVTSNVAYDAFGHCYYFEGTENFQNFR